MTAAADQQVILRFPAAGWLGALGAAGLVGLVGIGMLAFAILAVAGGTSGLGLFTALIAAVLIGLSLYALRDALARWHWRIAVAPDGLVVDLPRHRSIVASLQSVHARLPFDRIEAIETRLEAYRSLGTVNMQRSYGLKLEDGGVIVLGEDRAQGTSMSSTVLANAVDVIARRGGLQIRDLGMAKGRGGVLSVLNAAPPPSDAPPLSTEEQSMLWRSAERTGQAAFLLALVVMVAAMLSFLF